MKLHRATALLLLATLLLLSCSCGRGRGRIEAPGEGEAQITFLNVGQADCAVIRTADAVIVVDTGCEASDGAELLTYLENTDIERIDLLVLTHPHEDHIGGASALLREYVVGECLMTDLVDNSVVFRKTLDALKAEGCKVTRAFNDVLREYGALSVEVLSPTKEFYSTVNDAGAVIRVRFGDKAMLFMADVSQTVEKELLQLCPEDLDVDILKVAHHGSASSTSPEFLAAVTPQYAVISCGVGNEYELPHVDVLLRLARVGASVHRTDTEGTATFLVKDGEISVK